MTDPVAEYLRLSDQIEEMFAADPNAADTPDAEAVYAQMDLLWPKLSPEQEKQVRLELSRRNAERKQ
jgi:hypothetical protein